MGAPDLHDPIPLARLAVQRVAKCANRWNEPLGDLGCDRHVECGRERVVRRLAHVHVVVGVDRFLAATRARRQLVGAPGDHLVHVHVRLRARAGLPDPQRELGSERPPVVGDLVGRPRDQFVSLGRQQPEVSVDVGCRALEQAERANDRPRHRVAPHGEEVQRALRLGRPVVFGRDLDRPHGVGFGAGRCGRSGGHVGGRQLAHSVESIGLECAPMSIIPWTRASVAPESDQARRPELATLPVGIPDLATLFSFMRDAELRFSTLRMRIEEHTWGARGEQVLLHEVVLRHPNLAKVTTSEPGARRARQLRDLVHGRREHPHLLGHPPPRDKPAHPGDGRRCRRSRPAGLLARVSRPHHAPHGVAARDVRPPRWLSARTSWRRGRRGSSRRPSTSVARRSSWCASTRA